MPRCSSPRSVISTRRRDRANTHAHYHSQGCDTLASPPALLEDPLRARPSSTSLSLSLVLCALSCSRYLAVSCHALSLSRLDKSTRPRSSTWTYFAAGEPFAHEPIWYWQWSAHIIAQRTACRPGSKSPRTAAKLRPTAALYDHVLGHMRLQMKSGLSS